VSSSPRRWRGACIKATFAVIAPERELAWTGVAMGWIKAIDRFRLAPTGDGQTTVTMEETMSGPLLTLFYNDGKLQISCRLVLASGDLLGHLGHRAYRAAASRYLRPGPSAVTTSAALRYPESR
jgi:hypothetical protein